jgi:hypothetical protein
MIWCRLKIDTGYHYVYVRKEFAMHLCIKQGYEINIQPEEIPEDVKREYNQ